VKDTKDMTETAADLSPSARDAIAEALNQCVAETAVTTMLAQNFHWNVTGMAFGPLHDLFQTIYEDHFTAQDDLAERIKALDAHAEGVLADMIKRSKVAEHDGRTDAATMVATMQKAQETLAATLAQTGQLAAEHGDSLTEDLCIARGQTHEKFAWMLRSHLR
jgi:starvation-inducible DNA-binding protein